MPAHINAALTATSLSIPIAAGRLGLGTWQGIYVWEHRDDGGARQLLVHVGNLRETQPVAVWRKAARRARRWSTAWT